MSERRYTTLLIDTSIYDGSGLRLEKGLLGTLIQFKDAPTKFIIPDVILGEIKTHLGKKVKESKALVEKAMEEAGDYLFYTGSELISAKKLLLESDEVDNAAELRMNNFINNTGAIILNTDDYVSVRELLNKYFKNEPPFAESGKKKNEFPDAITLMAVDAWAEENSEVVYAVAGDNDWSKYCETSKNIDYYKDLGQALAYFNTENRHQAFITRLQNDIDNHNANNFIAEISSLLDSKISNIFPNQDADSSEIWEPEGCQLSFIDFEFVEDSFKVVFDKLGRVVLEADVEIRYEAEGDFSLYAYDSIDKDNVFIDSVSSTVEGLLETRLLITLSGDDGEILKEDDLNLEIEDIEVLDIPKTIHYGWLEPHFEPEYDD